LENCNDCKKLEAIVETDENGKSINHKCTTHDVSVRYATKRFKGYIWPCLECNGIDFIKK